METAPNNTSTTTPHIFKQSRLKYTLYMYSRTFNVAAVFFIFFSIYNFLQRGYFDLYIANKVIADISTLMLGLVLLIGPVSRLFNFADKALKYRKALGITAFHLAMAHGIITLFMQPEKFPLSRFFGRVNWPFYYASTAVIILLIIFSISNDKAMKLLGTKIWWRIQYLGVRSAFIFIILHFFLLKYKGWIEWYKSTGDSKLIHPEWPSSALIIGWFVLFVVLFRICEYISPKLGQLFWYFSCIALPLIYITTFMWGARYI